MRVPLSKPAKRKQISPKAKSPVSRKPFRILCLCAEGQGHSASAATRIKDVLYDIKPGTPRPALGDKNRYQMSADGEKVTVTLRGFWKSAKPDRRFKPADAERADWIVFPVIVNDEQRLSMLIGDKKTAKLLVHANEKGKVLDTNFLNRPDAEVKEKIVRAAKAKRMIPERYRRS